jgi:hypothetical protein
VEFEIDTTQLDEWIARIEAAIEAAPETCARIANEGGDLLALALGVNAPFDGAANNGVLPNEAGHLNQSFGYNEATPGESCVAEVWTNEPIKYQYVTQGTATPILPVQKMALWWPDAAHPVAFVRGQEANPFQEKAKADFESEFPDAANTIVAEWLGEI